MSFWNDLCKNLSTAANSAAKSASNFAQITKLNVALSAARGRLNDCYAEIGKLYDDKTASGLELEDAISAKQKEAEVLKTEIKDLRKQLAVLKKIRLCVGCGRTIPKDAKFCPYCSAEQNVPGPSTEDKNEEA